MMGTFSSMAVISASLFFNIVMGPLQRRFAYFEVPEEKAGRLNDAGDGKGAIDEHHGGKQEEVADHVGKAENARILGEGKFRSDGGGYRSRHHAEYGAVEGSAVRYQKAETGDEDERDDIFAVDLKWGQPRAFDEAGGKETAEYRHEQGNGNAAVERQHPPGPEPSPDEQGSNQEGDAEEVTEGDPELRGQVRGGPGKDAHAFVGKSMDQLDGRRAEQGNADKEQVLVVLNAAGVPGKDEDDRGRDDAKQFCQAVEEEVTGEAAGVEAGNDQDAEQSRERVARKMGLYKKSAHYYRV